MESGRGPIVAIDGPAGAGKSTTARLVAERLGYLYIDTGAMYRAVTLKAQRYGVDLSDDQALVDVVGGCVIKLEADASGSRVYLDGEDISDEIRTPEIDRDVSRVSEVQGVREALVAQQRQMGNKGRVVMEGRDIATVVFPDAELKVYLVAGADERALRRQKQLMEKGVERPLESVLKELLDRDEANEHREHSPLKRAEDAVELDNTTLTIEEQVETVVRWVHETHSVSK